MFLGPQRLRKWFGRQNNYRRSIQNSIKSRTFPSVARRIPLRRNNAAFKEGSSEPTTQQFKDQKSKSERLGRQLMVGPASKLLPSDTRSPLETSSPVVLDESLADRLIRQKQQRENKVNQNRGLLPLEGQRSEGKSTSKHSFKRTNRETSFPNEKRNSTKIKKFEPKGISLTYNFRAVANQTKITLNERFSNLNLIRADVTVPKPAYRTVTLP